LTLRALEQIELDICYQENPVVLVGVGGGHAYGTAGPTHHAYLDIATMRMLPNMTVVCPADPVEMREVMLASESYGKPLYIRIGRSVDPVIHKEPISFQIGKAIPMREGEDAVLFATGTMVKDAVRACELLDKQGISVSLYSMHTIKPIDEELVKACMARYQLLFTLEEHSRNGGLGSAVGDVMQDCEKGICAKLYRLGFPDTFAPVTGSREYLNALYGLDAESVAETIRKAVEEQKL
jgi:transketolase